MSLASAASTAHSAPHGSGLLFGVRGIVGKEVRSRTRGWRPMIVLTTYPEYLSVKCSRSRARKWLNFEPKVRISDES